VVVVVGLGNDIGDGATVGLDTMFPEDNAERAQRVSRQSQHDDMFPDAIDMKQTAGDPGNDGNPRNRRMTMPVQVEGASARTWPFVVCVHVLWHCFYLMARLTAQPLAAGTFTQSGRYRKHCSVPNLRAAGFLRSSNMRSRVIDNMQRDLMNQFSKGGNTTSRVTYHRSSYVEMSEEEDWEGGSDVDTDVGRPEPELHHTVIAEEGESGSTSTSTDRSEGGGAYCGCVRAVDAIVHVPCAWNRCSKRCPHSVTPPTNRQ